MITILTIIMMGLGAIFIALPLLYLLSSRFLKRKTDKLASVLSVTADIIDHVNEKIGRTVAWLTILMVLVQTIVVLQRYVFGINFIWMQESITYMHGILFMVAAGFTLLHNGHVRVDIVYREASPKRKALTDFLGTYLFLFPVMIVICYMALPYVEIAWRIREGSTETSGIQGIYLLKSIILVFATVMIMQGISLASRTALVLTGRDTGPGTVKESALTI